MKYSWLIWAGIWRKRGRSVLMLVQIVSAFVLFGLLQGIDSGVKAVIAKAHGDRLYVSSRVSRGDTLPTGMFSRLQSIPGVEQASRTEGFGGTYQQRDQFVPVTAVDIDEYFKVYDEWQVAPAGAIPALAQLRTGAIVGGVTMRKYGWKVGDHVVLQGNVPKADGSFDWGFDIVGSYEIPDYPDNADSMIVAYGYLNESRATGRDRVNMFVLTIDDAAQAGTVSLAIDNTFANSSNETRTQSEADLISASLQQLGNLGFIIRGVIGAVFFAVLFATGALMMQSARERTAELAALKAVGFSDRRVMGLLLAESTIFCVVAAAIGLGIAAALMPFASALGMQGLTGIPGVVFVAGIGCALILALLSAGVPAWRGARLRVAAALADR